MALWAVWALGLPGFGRPATGRWLQGSQKGNNRVSYSSSAICTAFKAAPLSN